ncbi:MAG: hypothetical protein V1806_08045 [Pseudomonadota bacterium]
MRKQRILVSLLAACLLVAFSAVVALAEGQVFQGVAVSYDAQGKVMVLKNSEAQKNKVDKNLAEVTFDLSQAKVGIPPTPGDKIRVAYEMAGAKYMALKVMNVTKQDLRKK